MKAANCPRFGRLVMLALFVWFASSAQAFGQQVDPLPSWNDGPAKKAIVEFVQVTTTQGSPKFVPPEVRMPRSTRTAHSGSSTRCAPR